MPLFFEGGHKEESIKKKIPCVVHFQIKNIARILNIHTNQQRKIHIFNLNMPPHDMYIPGKSMPSRIFRAINAVIPWPLGGTSHTL
jgi:hypothetical protein